ncbi:MMPL family transporter [Prescottella equi]|uniref:MMPL family transporter n=1 Tax=Rhodococcus hoagii TaxID=43767 RepID=UPI0019F7F06A|nr:MMPL family transporter [Prescottella equi]MCD7051791.1 MMPL family transporter [Rhodococcus sp. BH2-1]NKS82388.1 MMPL family transporter [Prescottella equi]WJJ12008.1 MMPL family transporter [Prescottella equi]
MTRVESSGDTPPGTVTRVRRGWPVFTVVAIAIVAFFLGGLGGSFQGKLAEVQKNDNASYLPGSAESTIVANESAKFLKVETIPGAVVFHRDSGLTDADKAAIDQARISMASVEGVDADGVTPTQISTDGTTASVFVPLIAKQDGATVQGNDLAAAEQDVIDAAQNAVPSDLEVLPAGPGGLLVAFIDAFEGLDSTLLGVALLVVILILLVVYRSPILWFFPLFSALLALGLSSMVIYVLADHEILTLTGQSQGILFVLVIGAGTDYALLLIARYREELHFHDNRFDAMIKAWRESAPAITASAVTVILGLLCLGFSQLNSNKSLGPVAAIGIACTYVVMMTFLPVVLSAVGRWVFWPRKPRTDGATDLATHGLWGRIADVVGRRDRPAWIGATVLLAVLFAVGIGSLQTSGLTATENFTNEPDAVRGQALYDANFDQGAGAPAVVATNASTVDAVIAAASGVEGVRQGPGSVCVQVDIEKVKALLQNSGGNAQQLPPGCPPSLLNVAPIDGRTIVNVALADSYDSPEALETVERLRDTLHAVPGADALVGGSSAATLDVQTASVHDRNLIIPIVLVVIFIVLAVLLRALLTPLILIATVVLSFAATLGVCGFFFTHVFHFAGADQSFPLFAFVFLVALGIDYNIFLMTRVREETLTHGTRSGVLRGLAVTGGVITSAGIVLAGTFAVLGVLPLVFLAEVGFAVAFGVLLDTIVVRSVLVPALSHDIGRKIWWPSKLAQAQN